MIEKLFHFVSALLSLGTDRLYSPSFRQPFGVSLRIEDSVVLAKGINDFRSALQKLSSLRSNHTVFVGALVNP